MKIQYINRRFASKTTALINAANTFLESYTEQGFVLTIRQLYYRLVSEKFITNDERSYKNLVSLMSNARLAGLVDWRHLVDRTRFLRSLSHWNDPSQIIRDCVDSYHVSMWENQKYRPEIWIEKDALVDVALKAGQAFDVPVFSCRGYPSQSEIWAASMRLRHYLDHDYEPIIFHLGDHDPSGIDMTRDIFDRMEMFQVHALDVNRIALNMDQIEHYALDPDPAKVTDVRFNKYRDIFGEDSWELDALEPNVIVTLLEKKIKKYIRKPQWANDKRRESRDKRRLESLSANNEFYTKYGFESSELGRPNDYY